MAKALPIMVGQHWRNKVSGNTIRVTQMTSYYGSAIVRWVKVEGKGQRNGVRWERNWNRSYELVEEAPADV